MNSMSNPQRVTVSKAAKSRAIRSALSGKTVRVTSTTSKSRSGSFSQNSSKK